MTCFLTSSPTVWGTTDFIPANGLADEMKRALPAACRTLFICSDPDSYDSTDGFAANMKTCFEKIGIRFTDYRVLDRRTQKEAIALVQNAEFIILAGGHVPTQNRFFTEIDLRGIIHTCQGVVMGISAGTMNSADIVYAQPELDGEAVDAGYQRFLVGLNLTKTMVLPHYQATRDTVLDGLRIFEDIAYPDSIGRKFYALVDGSYLYIRNGKEELRGEAYLIENGRISALSSVGDILPL